MIKIVQYGEGNFLRCFADAYFDTLNEEGYEYSVDIVTPIRGNLENFIKQNNRYNMVLRGVENGENIESKREISVLNSVIDPFENPEEYLCLL